jgi:GT2 family glycosyltransferase
LQRQAEKLNAEYEIILADDCSSVEFRNINKTLSELPNVQYIQLENNVGRSKIRNFLVSLSKYEKLFFADCDSEIGSENFLKLYVEASEKADIVCGGRKYRLSDLKKNEYVFRVKYGILRESAAAEQRNLFPNRSFMTNNFLISKSVFSAIQFDENLAQYGHEDTLFGCESARRGFKIIHISNPLFHIGLETAGEFLEKSKQGLINLKYITENYNYPELYFDIKLLRTVKKLRLFKSLVKVGFSVFKNRFEAILRSKNPNIYIFDLYKLGFYMSIKDTKID